jgi:hypothetical protein
LSLRLHIWKTADGGLMRLWRGRDVRSFQPFFIFGRCGGGYILFPPPRAKLIEEAALCTARARERFGVEAKVVWKRP